MHPMILQEELVAISNRTGMVATVHHNIVVTASDGLQIEDRRVRMA